MDTHRIRALRALYDQLPTIDCQGKCGYSCRTRIDMSSTERDRIQAFTGEPLPEWMPRTPGIPCPLLTPTGRCAVYRLRPLICRLWGVVDSPTMTCDHGCTVHGDKLTVVDANRVILESFQLGGHDHADDHALNEMRQALLDEPGFAPLIERYVGGDHSVANDIRDLANSRKKRR